MCAILRERGKKIEIIMQVKSLKWSINDNILFNCISYIDASQSDGEFGEQMRTKREIFS